MRARQPDRYPTANARRRTGELGQCGLAMHGQAGAVAADQRQQRARQRNLLVIGQIFLAQADPAAAAANAAGDDLGKRRRACRRQSRGAAADWEVLMPRALLQAVTARTPA